MSLFMRFSTTIVLEWAEGLVRIWIKNKILLGEEWDHSILTLVNHDFRNETDSITNACELGSSPLLELDHKL